MIVHRDANAHVMLITPTAPSAFVMHSASHTLTFNNLPCKQEYLFSSDQCIQRDKQTDRQNDRQTERPTYLAEVHCGVFGVCTLCDFLKITPQFTPVMTDTAKWPHNVTLMNITNIVGFHFNAILTPPSTPLTHVQIMYCGLSPTSQKYPHNVCYKLTNNPTHRPTDTQTDRQIDNSPA